MIDICFSGHVHGIKYKKFVLLSPPPLPPFLYFQPIYDVLPKVVNLSSLGLSLSCVEFSFGSLFFSHI